VIDNDVLSAALVDSGLKDGEVAKKTWWNKHSGGLFRGGCDAQGQDLYTPLYILKEVRRPGPIRRIPARPPHEGDDLYVSLKLTALQLPRSQDHLPNISFVNYS
jgi:hypothetical protein